jgi:ABC-2 type transport system permease protein
MVPGLVAMTMLFSTTAMEAVVINFELRIGALERLLLAPISLAAVLMGKVLGGVLFGLVVSAVVTIVCIIGLGLLQWSLLWLLPVLLLSALVFSGLGAFISVSVREVFEAQTLANFVRFPMIFLCGVFVPLSSLPPLLRGIAYLLPLTYTVGGIQNAVASFSLTAILIDLLVLVAFAALFLPLALLILRRRLA